MGDVIDVGGVGFDWRNPDYLPIWKARAERLAKLRDDPALLAKVRVYYRDHVDDLINDWGVTVDPRVAAQKRRAIMPMLLWPKQRAYIRWLHERLNTSTPGTVVKSRDVGISWLTMAFFVGICIAHDDVSFGLGSEKEDKVDRSGDPDCLFYKGRLFLQYLPVEFRGGFTLKNHSAHMRLTFPNTGASITGEAGDNIGRGGRKLMYAADESAHIPNPKALDAALSANTDIRIDMSSVNGMSNSFAERAHNGDIARFDFSYKDDPRKDAAWEKKKRGELDANVFRQEYGCDFSASIEGQVIASEHVQAAIDAHVLLRMPLPSGQKVGALDVADAGKDYNAFGVSQQWLVHFVQQWKGSADLDIMHSVENAFSHADMNGLDGFWYDADGLGAGVRGDARTVNERRAENNVPLLSVEPFRGSGEVFEPEGTAEGTERTNLDFFENAKAQAWWTLRNRFQYTYRIVESFKTGTGEVYDAVMRGNVWEVVDAERFISIAKDFEHRARLCIELSQPVWMLSKNGKWMVDKCPKGTKTEVRAALVSPNLADTVMMLYAPRYQAFAINPALLAATAGTRR
jgi:phage terminase large subunit